MKMIAPLVKDYSLIDQRIYGLVLGAISDVLAVSTKFVRYQESLEIQIAKLASKLYLITQYGDSIFPKDLTLHKAMIKVYAVILKFCTEASRLFVNELGKKKASVMGLGKSAWESFEPKFGDIDTEFGSRLEDVKLAIGLWRDRAINRQQGLFDDIASHTKLLEQKQLETQRSKQFLRIYQFPVSNWLSTEKENWERLLDRLIWTSSFDEIQEERFLKLVEGTGQWLIDLDELQNWRAKPTSSLLWVHGKNGSGKSHLACRVIKDLRISCEASRGAAQSDKDLVALAYVYCSSLIDGDSDLKRLLGSIFKQLLEQVPAAVEIPLLYERLGNKHEPPTIGNIKNGIRILADWFSQTFLVIDGFDEYSWSERTVKDARQIKVITDVF